MIPFYITCFNSPFLLKRLVGQLDDIIYSGEYRIILSDQSDPAQAELYRDFADSKGFEYLHYQNQGATQAKKSVLSHALSCDFEFCHQMSEDFIRSTDELSRDVVVSGKASFDTDALTILRENPSFAFVKWNILTSHNGDMTYLYKNPTGVQVYKVSPKVQLPFLVGDICYSNWPSTWRVKELEKLRQKSLSWIAPTPFHEDQNRISAGEWAVSMSSFGLGACLVAQPFFHPDRNKPSNSLP